MVKFENRLYRMSISDRLAPSQRERLIKSDARAKTKLTIIQSV